MPLAIDRYELGPIGTNCYVVRTERGAPETVVFDPGADAAQLRLELARMGVTVAGIVITHTHYDHIGAVADLGDVDRRLLRGDAHPAVDGRDHAHR